VDRIKKFTIYTFLWTNAGAGAVSAWGKKIENSEIFR
jgi:hypothetical protein